jgi:hypothetical protein
MIHIYICARLLELLEEVVVVNNEDALDHITILVCSSCPKFGPLLRVLQCKVCVKESFFILMMMLYMYLSVSEEDRV